MRAFRFLLAGVVAGSLSIPSVARGEKSSDAARAEALFAEGRKLMAAGDFAAACPKFADSQSLDPAPGTVLNLATCYEKAGKLASAWATFKTAQASAEAAGQHDRVAAAKKRAATLEPQLSHLTITVPPSSRVPGIDVRCDQGAVHEGEWGVAVPRDGGGHDIEAVAPGKKAWTSHIELRRGGQDLEVEVPALEDAPAPAAVPRTIAPSGGPEAPGASAAPPRAVDNTPEHRGQTQRVLGLVAGGIGVAGIAFGAIAGIEAGSTWSDAKNQCGSNAPACPADSQGFATQQSAVGWASASTIGFAAGGALLAGGAVLFFTAPRGQSQPRLGVAPAAQGTGLSLLGMF
jgi:hypothetical protein